MQFKQTTILGFFDSSQKHFVIPVYQRAYSWGKEQWSVFLNDLIEQTLGDNNYFYGNILLETIKKDIQYEIIDGQQRLTTLVIFFRALIDVLYDMEKQERFDIDIKSKESIYLKNSGNIKLRTVEYDRACFDSLIIDGKKDFTPITPSQHKIKDAKEYFYTEIRKLSITEILKLIEKIESTEVTSIELNGKKDSALMFELQNNRGKDLTNMEKVKSYLMYQMYIYSSEDEVETNIEYISNIFKDIYITINDIKSLNEDSILIYHCNAFVKGFSYRNLDDIKENLKKSDNKILWIKSFADELRTSFLNIKKMERSTLKYLEDLRGLSIPAFAYPFIIKGYKYLNNDEDMNILYRVLEIVIFRYRLINSRADFTSRLNEILLAFSGDLEELISHFKRKLNEEYWSDSRMKSTLNGYMYGNSILHYLLWKYEESIQDKGYNINKVNLEDEQIEHISPRTPPNGNSIASGYDVEENNEYSDEFIDQKLNCLGNLMLISGSHNKSIGNKPFSEKINSYKSNPLLKQQAEIAKFLSDDLSIWKREQIDKRHKKIVDEFALSKWNFDSIEINDVLIREKK